MVQVLYDGGCGLCVRSVTVLTRLDWLERLQLVDVAREWTRVSSAIPTLNRDACLAEVHVVDRDGRLFAGFDAYRAIAWVVPAGWVALPLLYLPGTAWIGRRIYRAVASRRITTTCETRRAEALRHDYETPRG